MQIDWLLRKEIIREVIHKYLNSYISNEEEKERYPMYYEPDFKNITDKSIYWYTYWLLHEKNIDPSEELIKELQSEILKSPKIKDPEGHVNFKTFREQYRD
jgi:hypothetical protein